MNTHSTCKYLKQKKMRKRNVIIIDLGGVGGLGGLRIFGDHIVFKMERTGGSFVSNKL